MKPAEVLTQCLAAADESRVLPGVGRGVVTCGGGKYQYGIYVLVKMLRLGGYSGPVEVWHLGAREPVADVIRKLPGVMVRDAVAEVASAGLPSPAGGWENKATAMTRTAFRTAVFFDADAYPVKPLGPLFEAAEAEGEVFWRDLDNENLRWASFGLTPPKPAWAPVNGGQWAVDRHARRRQLAVYAALTDRSDVMYLHMLGDQDCQLLAWQQTGCRYFLPSLAVPQIVGGNWLYDMPDGTPYVVHRVGSKFGPPGAFDRGKYSGPVRGTPMERQATAFYAESVDLIGVPRSAK